MIFVQKFKKAALLCFGLSLFNPVYLQASNMNNSSIDVDMSPNTRLALSFDGGGIRGIFSLSIMNEIQKKLDFPFIQAFDIAFGTSTGGISVAALAHPDEQNPSNPKYSVGKVLELYRQYGQEIFPTTKWKWFSSVYNVFGAKYSAQGLKNVAQAYFEEGLLSDSIIPVGIVTNNISPNKPYVFHSDSFYKEADEKERDWYTKDVVIATSAAPTYFPIASISPVTCKDGVIQSSLQKFSYIDGGVSGMNNPSVAAYSCLCQQIDEEVKNDFENGAQQMSQEYLDTLSMLARANVRLISFGTGYVESSESLDKMENAGLMSWATSIINLTLGMPSLTSDDQMKTFLSPYVDQQGHKINRYHRFNTTIPESLAAMDDASAKNLHNLERAAQRYIDENQDKIAEVIKILQTRYAFKQQQNQASSSLYKAKDNQRYLEDKYAFELKRLNAAKIIVSNFNGQEPKERD